MRQKFKFETFFRKNDIFWQFQIYFDSFWTFWFKSILTSFYDYYFNFFKFCWSNVQLLEQVSNKFVQNLSKSAENCNFKVHFCFYLQRKLKNWFQAGFVTQLSNLPLLFPFFPHKEDSKCLGKSYSFFKILTSSVSSKQSGISNTHSCFG